MAEYIDREKTCGECIHADICKQVNGSWFSPHNIAYCKGFKNAADVVEVPSHNINDLQTAVKGLGVFRLSWCVKEWDGDEPSFHCSECPFEDKKTRKCSVKIFLRQHATREERDRFSPIV